MDQANRDAMRKRRYERLASEVAEVAKAAGISPEAAASLLVASYVGEVALDIHLLNNRLGEVETQFKALVAKK